MFCYIPYWVHVKVIAPKFYKLRPDYFQRIVYEN